MSLRSLLTLLGLTTLLALAGAAAALGDVAATLDASAELDATHALDTSRDQIGALTDDLDVSVEGAAGTAGLGIAEASASASVPNVGERVMQTLDGVLDSLRGLVGIIGATASVDAGLDGADASLHAGVEGSGEVATDGLLATLLGLLPF